MKKVLLTLFIAVSVCTTWATDTHAASLKIAPLKYETTLKTGETKKGYVDVSNPEYESVKVTLGVQAFRQIDDDGTLQYYSSAQVSDGIQLDLTSLTLKPRSAMRVYFLLNGNKLPSGDVFAAIFASTEPSGRSGAEQSVRVGTLIMLSNGTPSSHSADISFLRASWLQVGAGLRATVGVHNTADERTYTGFFPDVSVTAQPYSTTTVQGPLVFAGRTRTVDYKNDGNYFGPVRVIANAGGQPRSAWVFAITGYWMWLFPSIVLAIVAGVIWFRNSQPSISFRR